MFEIRNSTLQSLSISILLIVRPLGPNNRPMKLNVGYSSVGTKTFSTTVTNGPSVGGIFLTGSTFILANTWLVVSRIGFGFGQNRGSPLRMRIAFRTRAISPTTSCKKKFTDDPTKKSYAHVSKVQKLVRVAQFLLVAQ